MSVMEQGAITEYLQRAVTTVRELEAKANAAVAGPSGQQVYEELMREKAMFLASLADEGENFENSHPEIFARLERFSASATSSLSVGSVFFMSALLYPENHQPGQKNDLERLLDEAKGITNGQ